MLQLNTMLFGLLALIPFAWGAGESKPLPVIVGEVRVDRFVDRVEALGTLKANESVSLTTSVTETVSAIHFDDGQRVERGQVLVELNSGEERALLNEAQVRVAEAERQYQRVKSLAAQRSASESLLDERKLSLDTARALLLAVQSRLDDRLLKAPFAGVLGLRNISVGALLEPGDLITTLDDDSVLKLDFGVPSVFLPDLVPGIAIQARAGAYGDRVFDGKIRSIDSRVDPVTRSIQVRALIDNSQRTLKPGVLMRVELLRNPREAAMIPEEALLHLGRDHFVLLVGEGNVAERRQVHIGARRPGSVEVVKGLVAGDRVITRGNDKTRPGQIVEVIAVDDGAQALPAILDQSQSAPSLSEPSISGQAQ